MSNFLKNKTLIKLIQNIVIGRRSDFSEQYNLFGQNIFLNVTCVNISVTVAFLMPLSI